jgi:hypothetical protein
MAMRADINVAMAVWMVVAVVVAGVVVGGSARSRAVVRSTARAMRWGAGVGAVVARPGAVGVARRVEFGRGGAWSSGGIVGVAVDGRARLRRRR